MKPREFTAARCFKAVSQSLFLLFPGIRCWHSFVHCVRMVSGHRLLPLASLRCPVSARSASGLSLFFRCFFFLSAGCYPACMSIPAGFYPAFYAVHFCRILATISCLFHPRAAFLRPLRPNCIWTSAFAACPSRCSIYRSRPRCSLDEHYNGRE